jgi:hypothetical protein
MPVKQYSAEFLKLSRYAPHLIPNKETKVERLCDGLSPHIKKRNAFFEITNYFKMVHIATIAEKCIREAFADYVNRMQSMSMGASPPPPPSKRQSSGRSSGSSVRRSAPMSRVSYNAPIVASVGSHTLVSAGRVLELVFDMAKLATSSRIVPKRLLELRDLR